MLRAILMLFLPSMQQSPDSRPPMKVITDKLVKLVESNTIHKLEADAQDPSFITTRPYFEPSSTGNSLDSAASFLYSSHLSLDLIALISQPGCNWELHLPVTKTCSSQILPDVVILCVVEVAPSIWSVTALYKFLSMPIDDSQNYCTETCRLQKTPCDARLCGSKKSKLCSPASLWLKIYGSMAISIISVLSHVLLGWTQFGSHGMLLGVLL